MCILGGVCYFLYNKIHLYKEIDIDSNTESDIRTDRYKLVDTERHPKRGGRIHPFDLLAFWHFGILSAMPK